MAAAGRVCTDGRVRVLVRRFFAGLSARLRPLSVEGGWFAWLTIEAAQDTDKLK
jgi:hypothetical protein